MNVSVLTNRISGSLGLANDASHNDYLLMLSWLNEGIEQWLLRTKMVKKTTSINLTVGVGDYTLDTDILAFEDAYVVPVSGPEIMLQPVDTYDIRAMRRAATAVGGPPQYFAYEGQVFMIYPNPSSSTDTVHMVYVARPTASLAATGDSPSDATRGGIPAEWHGAIEAFAKWKGGEMTNDAASQNGQMFKQEFYQAMMESKAIEQRKAGVRVPRATVGNRRRNWSRYASPGIDTGR